MTTEPHPDAPHPTGGTKAITLTGMLMPWLSHDQPALLAFPGDPHRYVPVWSDVEDLRSFLARAECPFDWIKQIEDGPEFLESLRENQAPIRVAVNLRFTEQGRQRFHMIDPFRPT